MRSRLSSARIDSAGAEIVEISMPELAITQDALFTIVLSEGSTLHRKLIREQGDKYDPATRAIVQLGELVPATHYLAAQQARTLYRHAIKREFAEKRLDAMLWPTMPMTTAPP